MTNAAPFVRHSDFVAFLGKTLSDRGGTILIELNDLLQKARIDIGRARLVRHQDNRSAVGTSPYDLWIAADGRFEMYQRIQKYERFGNADRVISFVATPLNETLFVGVFAVRGVGFVQTGTIDPSSKRDVTGCHLYDLKLTDLLQEYAGRIVVEWGAGYRSWVQRPDRRNKPVIEIRRRAIEPPFPGFAAFSCRISELSSVPTTWRQVLSAVCGVYLLVCRSTGKQYVGSAYGAGGFWARWEDYFRNGHGGNVGMKSHPFNDYKVSVLEFTSSSSTKSEIIQAEERWKDQLLTRKFGLNK